MSKTVNIKLDSEDLYRLLQGQVVCVKAAYSNDEVNVLLQDDGSVVYREVCNKALDKVDETLVRV